MVIEINYNRECDVDYIQDLKEQVCKLIKNTFDDAVVYLTNPESIPAFGSGGTFCVEPIASSMFTSAGKDEACHSITLNIWTYANGDDESAEKELTVIAGRLECVLYYAGKRFPGDDIPGLRFYETEHLHTDYRKREIGRAFRRRRIWAACTFWRVQVILNDANN